MPKRGQKRTQQGRPTKKLPKAAAGAEAEIFDRHLSSDASTAASDTDANAAPDGAVGVMLMDHDGPQAVAQAVPADGPSSTSEGAAPAAPAAPGNAPANRRRPPDFNPAHWMDLYARKQHQELSQELLTILQHFHDVAYESLSDHARAYITQFVKHFLHLFTQEDYVLQNDQGMAFIRLNETISNLVSLTPFQTTDIYLGLLRLQQANYLKLLALYSPRNTTRIDLDALFKANREATSVWYNAYAAFVESGCLISDVAHENLKRHFSKISEDLVLAQAYHVPYFVVSYVDRMIERGVKGVINRAARQIIAGLPPLRRKPPVRNKIAVLSGCWFPGHSVHRTLAGYLRELPGYHLTLFQLGDRTEVDTSMFDEVHRVDFTSNALGIGPLENTDFMVAYFPDIGMSPHSVMLANMRIAPIQLCGTGHPVSTWGADIDYFISGADVEPTNAQQNYSERLVLLPGFGAVHELPTYTPVPAPRPDDRLIINCPWTGQKINAHMVECLRRIVGQSRQPLRIRVFSGHRPFFRGGYIGMVEQLRTLTGCECLEVLSRPYNAYLDLMSAGDLNIDCYPFGGSNTISDGLYLRKPTVVYEGDRWYSRIGSQMLRTIGLDELIAHDQDEYVEKVVRLVNDEAYREDITQRIKQADLAKTVFTTKDASSFRTAIEYLIDNHERLKSEGNQQPIHVQDLPVT